MEELVNGVARSLGVFPLKPEQLKAVLAFLEGRDVFVSLPTGFGKSSFWRTKKYRYDDYSMLYL